MKNYKLPLATMLLSLAITSCGGPSSSEIEAVPFKADEDDRWGIIDWEGNVIIEDEFDETPSVVREGLFYIKNKDGEYEFYTADKEFKQVGETYKEVAHFNNGLAPVVKKNERIKFINTDGEVQFELTQHEGKEIVKAYRFNEGRAVIINEDNKYGFINTDGEVVIAPKYERVLDFKNGYSVAFEADKTGEKIKTYIIDKDGDISLTVDEKMLVLDNPGEGLIPFIYIDKKEPALGYIDMDGEVAIEPNKKFEAGSSFQYGYAIVKEGSDYGIIDKNGETVIRPKYDEIVLLKDKFLFEDQYRWGVMNYEGETLVDNEYIRIRTVDGSNTMFAQGEDGDWIILDNEGKEISKDSYDKIADFDDERVAVNSDFVDIKAEAAKIVALITDKGIGKFTFGMTPEQVASIAKIEASSSLRYKEVISMPETVSRNQGVKISAGFKGEVVEPITKQVQERGWYSTYTVNKVVGYKFKNVPMDYLEIETAPTNKMYDKYTDFFNELKNAVKAAGFKEIKSEEFRNNEPADDYFYYQKGKMKICVCTMYETILIVAIQD